MNKDLEKKKRPDAKLLNFTRQHLCHINFFKY